MKKAKNFSCTPIVRLNEKDVHVSVHINSTTIEWEKYPQTIDFSHFFIKLHLKGAEFNINTLLNTESSSSSLIKVEFNSTSKHYNEASVGIVGEVSLGGKGASTKLSNQVNAKITDGKDKGHKSAY